MTQKITNVVLLGHRFKVMHANAPTDARNIGAVFVGDHPDDILLLLHTTTLNRIVAAVKAEAAALNTPTW